MKNKKLYAIILVALCVLCIFSFSACSKETLNLSVTTLELEAYDDYLITLPDGETGVTWSSSNESVAKVVDGKICCLGKKGEVVITAKQGKKEGKCTVKVVDSGLSPRLQGGDLVCYVNGLSTVDLEIRYNENYYTEYTVKSITVDDTTIAVGENGKLKGITEGQTTATVILEWKGISVKSREKVNITVKPEFTFVTDSEEYSVYSVNSVSTVKKNTTQIDAKLMVRGSEIENATITTTILNGEEYFSVDNDLVLTAKSVSEIKDCKLKLSAVYENKTIDKEITVKVYPNFDQREDNEFQSSLTNAIYQKYDGTVGGRDNVFIYQTGESCRGTGDWIKWGNHLELATLKTVDSKSQYDYVINTLGITLVSFDVYYQGYLNTETNQKEFRGVSVNAQYGPNNTDNLYYIGHVKNTPERLVVVDGVLTNKLVPETWTTFFIDLRLLDKGAQLDTYLVNNKVGDVSYVDNIRFWYDDQAIANLDKSNVDLDNRQINFVEGSSKITAPENEFMNYSPDYTTFEKTDDGYLYTAKAGVDYGGTNLLSQTLARRVFPYNIFKGLVVKKNVKYLSFDYMFLSGYPFLSIYDQQSETTTNIGLHETTVTDYKVSIYDKQGNKIEKIVKDTWYTIIVETHINTGSNDTFYLTTTNVGTSFKIKNYNYWLDDSGKYEIGFNDLFTAQVKNLDYAFTNSEVDIKDLITARFKGKVNSDYTVEDVMIADTEIASFNNGVITLLSDGVTDISFVVKYSCGEYSYEKEFTAQIKSFGQNTLIIGEKEITLNKANEGLSSKNVIVSVLVINGEIASAEDKVKLSILEGSDVISVNGLTVTALKVGTAKIKAYAQLSDGELYEEITVKVIDSDWALFAKNSQNKYEDGKLTLSKNVWNDYLILIATDGRYGTNPSVSSDWDARQALIANNVNYITFTVKVISGATRIYCPILPDGQTCITLSTTGFTVDRIYADAVNELIELYTLDGERIAEGEILTANTEYRVVIKYESTSKGWAEVCLKGDYGEVEVSNVTYLETNDYHKDFENKFILSQTEIELNLSNTGLASKEVEVVSVMANGKKYYEEDVKLSIVEGNGIVYIEELSLTALAVGTAKVKAYVELGNGEEFSTEINVNVIDNDWSLFSGSKNTYENGQLTLSSDVWNDYLILIDTDGRKGTNPTVKNDWEARQSLIAKNANYLTFTIKLISGSVRIYCPVLPDGQTCLVLSTDKFTIDKYYPSQCNELIELYTLTGERLTEYDKLTANTEYRVVMKYESASTGWAEICIKGGNGQVEVSNVTYLETNIYHEEYQTWGLKENSANTFENGVFTLSNDIWNDYLILRATDARYGTNSNVTADWEVRNNFISQNINYIEFTVKVSSGTARIYTPLPDVDTVTKLGYIGVSTTGLIIDPNNANVIDYISIYDMSGNKLDTTSTLTADTEYKVVIKYEHTLCKGWAEVCIKGQATTVAVSQAKFYTEII